jgi:V8-like Glu-specific endopeptidase
MKGVEIMVDRGARVLLCAGISFMLMAGLSFARQVVVEEVGEVMVVTRIDPEADRPLDYANARPMMPVSTVGPQRMSSAGITGWQPDGAPGFEPGARGNSRMTVFEMPMGDVDPVQDYIDDSVRTPQEYGVSGHPFTTSRVDVRRNNPSRDYPFSPSGKLYFRIGEDSYVCSASLIKRGIVVTAAHCVTDYGTEQFFSDWEFVPAQFREAAPYGKWRIESLAVNASYVRGTDECAVEGVVCENDVAVLVVEPQDGNLPGTATGWYGYGWNGWGFTREGLTLINQLGYPVNLDSGLIMQRTDSQGYVDETSCFNTIWGSRQGPGSSGGPNLVNLGISGSFTNNWMIDFNIVVGVTSWGYTDSFVKQQGSSPFTSRNIKALVDIACRAYPSACR